MKMVMFIILLLVGCDLSDKTTRIDPPQPLEANMVCVNGIAHAWYDKGGIKPKLRQDGTPCVCISMNTSRMGYQ